MAIGDDLTDSFYSGIDAPSTLGDYYFGDPYGVPPADDYEPTDETWQASTQADDPSWYSSLWNTVSGAAGATGGAVGSAGSGIVSSIGKFLSGIPAERLLTMGIGGVLATAGLIMQPGGQVKTPDGRTVQLSPAEQQQLQLIANNAEQNAQISTPVNKAFSDAATRNQGAIGEYLDRSLSNLPKQQATQNRVSEMTDKQIRQQGTRLLQDDTKIANQSNRNLVDILREGGVGKNDAITKGYADRVKQALQGEGSIDPRLERLQEEQMRKAHAAALRAGGTGYETTTWFNQGLNDLQSRHNEEDFTSRRQILTEDNAQRLASQAGNQDYLNSIFTRAQGATGKGMPTLAGLHALNQTGGGTAAGAFEALTGRSPVASAATGLGALAGIGNQQAGNALQAAMFNSQQANQNRNALLGAGGGLFGYGLRRTS